MFPSNSLLLLFICCCALPPRLPFAPVAAAAATSTRKSAYDVLRGHGLPIGILPKGVKDFAIDESGRFEARIGAPCTAKFESEVKYSATVTGTISPGEIAGLSGISAQDLFLWFPVRAIRLDNSTAGIIHFDVGVVDKRYPLSLFEVPPDCSPESSRVLQPREGADAAVLVSQYDAKCSTKMNEKHHFFTGDIGEIRLVHVGSETNVVGDKGSCRN